MFVISGVHIVSIGLSRSNVSLIIVTLTVQGLGHTLELTNQYTRFALELIVLPNGGNRCNGAHPVANQGRNTCRIETPRPTPSPRPTVQSLSAGAEGGH